jgi:hypothetical protein
VGGVADVGGQPATRDRMPVNHPRRRQTSNVWPATVGAAAAASGARCWVYRRWVRCRRVVCAAALPPPLQSMDAGPQDAGTAGIRPYRSKSRASAPEKRLSPLTQNSGLTDPHRL